MRSKISIVLLFSYCLCCAQSSEVPIKDQTNLENRQTATLGISMASEVFSAVFDPMYYTGVSYQQNTKYGSIIGMMNLNQRFSDWGSQYVLDLYPKISKGVYAYLSYAYSSAIIFPEHRIGTEVYVNYSKGWESSVGVRWMRFSSIRTTIYTGSLGWYRGNWYYSLRPNVALLSNDEAGMSLSFLTRKYLTEKNHYWGVSLGWGTRPEIQDSGVAIFLYNVESQYLNLNYQFVRKKSKNPIKCSFGIARQEKVYEPNSYFMGFKGGITYYFGV